ncbi:MAG TPA: hypothetical protein VFQ25_08465 [Ktedonobacterales bacterium]|nr:hypothetical protein [Ktedonobacterales bacterium]
MTTAMRWRIIVLQIIALLVFAGASGAAFYASNFTSTQIHDQLAPQLIYFPKDAKSGLPADLSAYAGQQVLNGDQAHAYAEKYIGLHMKEIGQGHPYSYWSSQARTATDPALAAKYQGIADTMFKGDTLRTMLNTAWTFSVFGQIAFYAAIGLLVAALAVLGALAFEVVEVVRGKEVAEVLAVHEEPTHRGEPTLSHA